MTRAVIGEHESFLAAAKAQTFQQVLQIIVAQHHHRSGRIEASRIAQLGGDDIFLLSVRAFNRLKMAHNTAVQGLQPFVVAAGIFVRLEIFGSLFRRLSWKSHIHIPENRDRVLLYYYSRK